MRSLGAMERKWWTLLAVCIGTFMLLLDVTIVNTALPYIERALGASFSDLQWVIDAYALSLAALLLTGGSLSDLFGRRLVFVVGLAVFTLASLACGLAGSPLALNLARAVQGVGGALMFATALALLANAFQGADRGTAFGLWGATTGAAVAIGPLVGGALTQGLGWEYIFFVNVPIGAGAIALTLATVDESRSPAEGRVDWTGLVTFSAGLFCLVFALIRGNAEGWTSGLIVGLLVASVLLLVAFTLAERRQRFPMLDLTLFRKPAFDGASIAAFSLSAAMFAMFLYLTLYVQNALGYSALEAGLRFLPVTLLSFFVAPVSGKLSERFGVRWFIAGGLALVGAGLLLMRRIEPGDDWTAMLAGFMVAGGGIGAVNPALATAAISVVEPHRSGMASGINSTFRQVGIATGTAALGAIFTHVVNGQASAFGAEASRAGVDVGAGQRAGEFSDFISFGGFRQIGGGESVLLAGREAFLDGLHLILLYGAVTAFISAALCAVLIRPSGFVQRGEPVQPAERASGEPSLDVA
jgi:EmrB/QacA subfamily drug resistance transporter